MYRTIVRRARETWLWAFALWLQLLVGLVAILPADTASAVAPVLQGALSRSVHGAAGTFDLTLAISGNPTTEPRRGPAHTVVFTFDKAVNGATVAVTLGAATAAAPTFNGSNVIVNLTAVTDQQFVSIALTDVTAVDGGTGGAGSVQIGFLQGDVNQDRVVTVSDVSQVNAQLASPVTVSNFLKDIDASGAITVADKAATNSQLAKALPALPSAKVITSFAITAPSAAGTINENAKTIAVELPIGTNVTALVATFTTTGVGGVKVGVTPQVSGTTPNDFTSPVIFTVTAADASTVDYTATVNLVTVPPTITAHPASTSASVGQTANFSVTATGTAPLGYQWRKNGNDITGANGPGYTTLALAVGDNGALYSAVVSNGGGNEPSNSAALTVNKAATTTALGSSLNPSTNGQTVTFAATVTGIAPTGTVAFKDNGVNIGGCGAAAVTGTGNVRGAVCSTGLLPQGTRPITAVYSGDSSNATSTSSVLSQVVNGAGGGGNCGMAVEDLGAIKFNSSKVHFDLGSGLLEVAVAYYTAVSANQGKTTVLDIYEYIGGPVERTVWVSLNRCEMTDATRLVKADSAPKIGFSVGGPQIFPKMVNMAVGETWYVMVRNWRYTDNYPNGKNSCIDVGFGSFPCATVMSGALW